MKKKKATSINFIISLEVYPYDLMVSIGQSDHELGKSIDKTGISNLLSVDEINACRYKNDNHKAMTILFSTNQSLIRIRTLPSTCGDYGIIAHEIFHVVANIMELVGMELKVMVSCEAYAYLTGYITEKFYHKINKYY